jgi:hypothetical protein
LQVVGVAVGAAAQSRVVVNALEVTLLVTTPRLREKILSTTHTSVSVAVAVTVKVSVMVAE